MGVRATCAVDRLRRDKDDLTDEVRRLKVDFKRMEKDIDQLEKGETVRMAEIKRQN